MWHWILHTYSSVLWNFRIVVQTWWAGWSRHCRWRDCKSIRCSRNTKLSRQPVGIRGTKYRNTLGRHTWKWGLATDFASWLKRGSWTFANSLGSITSKISSISFKNMTSLVLLVLGQYRNKPRTTCRISIMARDGRWGKLLPLTRRLSPKTAQYSTPTVDDTCLDF